MSNDKTAEEPKKRIRKDEKWLLYVQKVREEERERSAQQLKEYKEVIRELLPFAELAVVSLILKQNYYDEYKVLKESARKLIDQTDSTK